MEPVMEVAIVADEAKATLIVDEFIGTVQKAVIDVVGVLQVYAELDVEPAGVLSVVDTPAIKFPMIAIPKPVVASGLPERADVGSLMPETHEDGWEESITHPEPPAMPMLRVMPDPSNTTE
ncbi:hypothetical protein Nepgr_018537 [Nepenthes gracilis]|uniref:Uncharacterized protein n=1 Tax=Nepenthes gracilis TaxID=150966 RepID=A0AAD3XUE7_NEPGR|nr:hypothetical protein Nepgr_018537 [Nepenthes gracilis]